MDGSTPRIDRREFLLALAAGVPLSNLGCGEGESNELQAEFRAGGPSLDVAAPAAEATVGIAVETALLAQDLLIGDEQACSVPKSMAVAVGDQIRVIRNSTEYAVYT